MSKIESVAEAMLDDMEIFASWAEESDDIKAVYRSLARAAISAMREPDEPCENGFQGIQGVIPRRYDRVAVCA